MKAKIALIDDHTLLRSGIASLLRHLNYEVVLEAANGIEFTERLQPDALPQVVLMDINMPRMDGYQTTLWLKEHYPSVKVLAISMIDDETAIIRMLRNGAKGYLLKECQPEELERAITAVLTRGFYASDLIASPLMQVVHGTDKKALTDDVVITDKELEFLVLACTEMTYKEIAVKLGVSPRTVDNYRDALHEKLHCNSRVGLMLYAIRHRLVSV